MARSIDSFRKDTLVEYIRQRCARSAYLVGDLEQNERHIRFEELMARSDELRARIEALPAFDSLDMAKHHRLAKKYLQLSREWDHVSAMISKLQGEGA
jgi:hypothetical protein